MEINILGQARRLGDHVNTDYIISSSRKRESLDPSVLRRYLLETLDPQFAASVKEGDLLVAGRNFGCGSAMEVAATVVRGAGIKAVLALSFARTYYRNAINNGLIPLECDTSGIREGDRLRVRLSQDIASVINETTGLGVCIRPFSKIALDILEAGGLVPYFRRHRSLALSHPGRLDNSQGPFQGQGSPRKDS